MTRRIFPERPLTRNEIAARYRKKHAAKIAAYRAENRKAEEAKYRAEYHDKIYARQKAWYDANKERTAVLKKAYYEKNKAMFIAKAAMWNKANPEYRKSVNAAVCARRVAAKLKATPAWANHFFIEEIYDLAYRRNKCLSGGVRWQVDHIVPLQSKKVCGLHVEHNLRVIPAKDNLLKSNKYWPDMATGA